MNKGLSPIVASVILIATTMAIAGILSFWAGSFVEKKVEESENTTTDIVCLNARFNLFTKCQYNSQTKEISFILENQANQDIILDSLYVFYPSNNLKSYKLSIKLPANNLLPFNQTGIDPGFISFQLRTKCPNVYRDFNCTEVS
ncbi:MAG: hypothetical protein KQA41_01325 [Candidatus Aenigmarchaeota archaeon]|nr:hypothetical protein [Candidatus Aenigmarchaeota archaeon]MBU5688852.1 hypothetical protein [Candidatus Aenigmarchaeota archaeon]